MGEIYRNRIFSIHLSDRELEKVQYLSCIPDFSLDSLEEKLRMTIEDLYEEHYKYPPTEFEIQAAEVLGPALLQFADYLQEREKNIQSNEEDV